MSSIIKNIMTKYRALYVQKKELINLFDNMDCENRKAVDAKSDEGMLHIITCVNKKHPYYGNQFNAKCTIDSCPI